MPMPYKGGRAAAQARYNGTAREKARRAARGRSRYRLEKAGVVRKGDGKDVHHKDGNPKNTGRKNLKVTTKAANRSHKKMSKGKRSKAR